MMVVEVYLRAQEVAAAKQRLRKANEELANLDRFKTEFFANVSHELRTPLGLILGPTERLLANPELADGERRELEVVSRNARLLLKHVNDLLDLAKLEAGKMKVDYSGVDLSSLVRVVAAYFETPAQDKKIAYAVEVADRVRAEVDPDKIHRILVNLLSNALKFTPAGGRIRCSLAVVADRIVLEVADSGIGIPPEERAAVFERFHQVDGGATRRFGGTGLGLAIARDFVDLHRGTIEIGDAPEGGALVTVALPRFAPDGAIVRQEAEAAPAATERARQVVEELRPRPTATCEAAGKGRTLVLVVEDNADMNRFVREALAGEHRVESAFDGAEGLDRALALRPDVILTDVMMPRMGGEELVRAVRARNELDETPILLLSAKADDALRVRLLRNGAQDYLTKPFHEEELRARVGILSAAKLARETSRRFAQNLEEANRELESFSYSVSHDLRAPLRAIDGFSQILADECQEKLDEKERGYLGRIRAGCIRMNGLIDDMLALSRVTRREMRKRSIDLSGLARSVVEEMRQAHPDRSIEVVIEDGVVAPGDVALLRIVLENLLGNAWKFTSKQPRPRIEFGVQPGGQPVYFIRDNGAGFDMRYKEKLFGVFQRLHHAAEFEGTGIGLATVRRVVNRHGGRVWAEGDIGRGATFYFSLPQ
jgi:signal transduction histidine kinase